MSLDKKTRIVNSLEPPGILEPSGIHTKLNYQQRNNLRLFIHRFNFN